MTGKEMIEDLHLSIPKSSDQGVLNAKITACHIDLLDIHSRALAAHCECLAMNADNCVSASLGAKIQYTEVDYYKVLKKWSIIDEKGQPLI
jgi:hypothetical protein